MRVGRWTQFGPKRESIRTSIASASQAEIARMSGDVRESTEETLTETNWPAARATSLLARHPLQASQALLKKTVRESAS